jgi:hypothetical protein
MSNECCNYLCLYGNQSEIDEFMELIYDKKTLKTQRYIDCRRMLPKTKNLLNKKIISVLNKEVDEDNYIGYDTVYEDEVLIFKTRWGPNVTPILYVSYLFPNVTFDLLYDEPNEDFEGECVFENGRVVEDYEVSEVSSKKPKLKIYTTQSRTIEDFKEIKTEFSTFSKNRITFHGDRWY